jgi:hypothetical protein
VFSVVERFSQTHDCHLLRYASSITPFNVTKDQLMFTVNRMSVLLMSEDESTKFCTLCKLDFNLFNWKVSLIYLIFKVRLSKLSKTSMSELWSAS